MRLHRPVVSVYTVPTDGPEADGTLAWDATTVVIAEVSSGSATGTARPTPPLAPVTTPVLPRFANAPFANAPFESGPLRMSRSTHHAP